MRRDRQLWRKSSASLLPLWIGWFLFAVYLLSFSGKFHVMDEVAVFSAGHNLARYGRADINQLIWTNHWTPNPPGIWGVDHNLYTKKPPGISFMAAPLIWLGHALPGLNAVQVGLLTNLFVTATTAVLLWVWLVDLGFAPFSAVLSALGYGLGTIAWVYARMFWESSLLALFFLIAVWAAYRTTREPGGKGGRGWLLLSGLAVAIGLTLRFEAIVATVLIGLYLLWSIVLSQSDEDALQRIPQFAALRRFLPALLLLYAVPTFLVAFALAWFNLARFGSLSETGYTQELLFRAPWLGGWGLLFSPGRGLFIYSPLMLLIFWGLRPAWRRLPRPYFWLIAALGLFFWLFYGSWFAWGGTWGWGPRFLLPILPLLMLFVAEPIEWASRPQPDLSKPWPGLGRLAMAALAGFSVAVNLLGITVDFNEHFLRLGRNENFVFNWAAFPPLGHWRILREGLVDLIWLQPGVDGLTVDWPSLTPALILLGLATVALASTFRSQKPGHRLPPIITVPLCLVLTASLTFQMMQATARIARRGEQTQADLPVLETLDASARSGDVLQVAMPPFGDVLETSTLLMANLDGPLPTYAWIESEPRALTPEERERIWQSTQAEAGRVWVFERWLTQDDPLNATTNHYSQAAFPMQQQWFGQSGRLTLYALAGDPRPGRLLPVNTPFQGDLTLVEASIWPEALAPGDILKVRLTWQVPEAEQLMLAGLPAPQLIAFVHLLDRPGAGRPLAQQDRLLLDLQKVAQSPLVPGQTGPQGYGLQLPNDLAPGSYPLIVGVYAATSGQRLLRTDDSPDDFLYLTDLQVQ